MDWKQYGWLCLCVLGVASAQEQGEAFDWMKNQADSSKPTTSVRASQKPRTMVLDRSQLAQQSPALISYLLTEALNRDYVDLLPELLSAYQKRVPKPDPYLIQRTQAVIAWHEGRTQEALQIYEQLLKQEDHPRVRLDFAASQARDGLRWSALKQFQQVWDRPDVPPEVKRNIARFMQALRPKWSWDVGLTPIYNNNLNQVAQPYCTPLGCQQTQALKAWGISYFVQARKLWLLPGRSMWGMDAQVDGENYSIDHQADYNTLNTRLGLQWLWQNRTQQWLISPFYRVHFAGKAKWTDLVENRLKPWSSRYGLTMNYVYRLGQNWRFVGAVDVYKQDYRQASYAQRNEAWVYQEQLFISRLLPQQWRIGYSLGGIQNVPVRAYVNSKINNTAYHQVHTGVILAKRYGRFQGQLSYWYAKRQFKGTALTAEFKPLARRDDEHRFGFAWSHQAFRWKGFLPQFELQYFKINSTHAWARQKGSKVFVKWQRQF